MMRFHETLPAELRWQVSQRINEICPAHWERIRLNEIARVQNGFAFESKFFSKNGGGYPLIRIRDVGAPDTETNYSGKFDQEYIVHHGDILIGMDGEFRCRKWLGRDALLNQRVCRLVPRNNNVHFEFFFKILQPYLDAVEQVTSSLTVKHLSSRTVEDLELPLPPLAEQRRIVAKIEALQERSRRAREALSEMGPLLEQFRQSVLAAAFRGDLTADWRAAHPNVEPASELLRRIRAERRRRWEQAELTKYEAKGQKISKNWQDKYEEPEPVDDSDLPELPEGWVWAIVDEISSHIVDCPHSTPKWTEEGKICVRTTEFRPGHLDLTNTRFVSEETFDKRIQRLKPQPGDVLYSREGGILGISCQVPPDTELCLGQRTMLMRTGVHFLGGLLMHWLNSPRTLDRVKRLTLGSASPHLNVGEVKRFPVPVAPLDEQSKLLEQIEVCLATPEVCGQIAKDYEQQLDHFDKSILAKAFRGELVPQDPCDEPASVLLERIRAQPKRQAKSPKETSKSHQTSNLGKNSSRLEPQQLTLAEVLRTAD